MGGATITAAAYHQQQHHNSSETLLTSCILVAFICFILTGSMTIALLSTAPVANQREFISGVFPNNQDHRIQFIVEDYEADPHDRFA